ncbi:WYL domain-containing protein [Pluralibacter gergoviae]|nr:WYL domain-containing protein [Pluralibacter gergoviae]ELC3016067.1 WYL domain-containing protein [Pluralibacter gergoviae]ELC3021047.1 WYL domain-containing protein [Pluralibacter gergoviae]
MEKRNIQLASRIADILVRLNGGETLYLSKLADEYGVHPRTIRRDIEERLTFLNLERDEKTKGYRISPAMLGHFDVESIRLFTRLAGISGLFPVLDKSTLATILGPGNEHNFIVHGHQYIVDDEHNDKFTRLQCTIDECRRVDFLYLRSGGEKRYAVEPYKLINYNGVWYLAAKHGDKLKNFTLSKIRSLNCTFEKFTLCDSLLQKVNQEKSVWGSEEKFEVVLKVSADVSEYFLRRKLLNEQVVEKKIDAGGLIVSTKISHKNEIFPVVQYWLPHLKIIAPEALQKELEENISRWLSK